MKLLLDIDGVMVPISSWKRPEFLSDNFPMFSSKATNALKRILEETNATIVLTTSHKSRYTLTEWITIFKRRGIEVDTLERLPENTLYKNRSEEILNWLSEQNSLESFIILDDDKSLNGLPSNLKENLLQTSSMIGLTDELVGEFLIKLKHAEVA
jgi:sugar-specific transcriptional regulator TrmB